MDDPGELRALVERYATVVDGRAFDSLDDVFHPDGVLITAGGTRNGVAEIRAAMQGLHRYAETDHRVGAANFTVDGDEAHGEVECEAHHWSIDDGRRTDRVMVITYHDEYERGADGWRIRRRRLEIHRQEELPAD